MKTIYVRLFGEGVPVHRPVAATELGQNKYLLHGEEIYDPEDEKWEFPPGTTVFADERTLEGERVWIATAQV
jgi:hypothetical protein